VYSHPNRVQKLENRNSNYTVTTTMIRGSITIIQCLFRLWMRMVSRYLVVVNILNKELCAANKQQSSSLASG